MSKPAEILLFEFLAESIDAALPDTVLFQLELHDTIYQPITKDRGLRISDAVGGFGPQPGGTEREYDVFVTIVAYAKVKGQNQQARQPAMQAVFDLQTKVHELLRNQSDLGGRVCDSLLRQGGRGYDALDGEPYAVANIPLIINPSGARYAGE